MLQLGFRVKELIGGLDCWRYDGYPIDGSETVEPVGFEFYKSGPTELADLRTTCADRNLGRRPNDHFVALPNIQMEPTRLTVHAIMSPGRARHLAR